MYDDTLRSTIYFYIKISVIYICCHCDESLFLFISVNIFCHNIIHTLAKMAWLDVIINSYVQNMCHIPMFRSNNRLSAYHENALLDFAVTSCNHTTKGPFTLGVIPAGYRAVSRTCSISALLFISA